MTFGTDKTVLESIAFVGLSALGWSWDLLLLVFESLVSEDKKSKKLNGFGLI
jgi:hypothetical protein